MRDTTTKLEKCQAGKYREGTANITRYGEVSSSIKIVFPSVGEMNACMPSLLRELRWGSLKNRLLEIGIAYAQLILTHPFTDGNGRSIRCFLTYLFRDSGLADEFLFETFIAFEEDFKKHNNHLDLIICENSNSWLNFYLGKVDLWITYIDLCLNAWERWLGRSLVSMEKMDLDLRMMNSFLKALKGSAIVSLDRGSYTI